MEEKKMILPRPPKELRKSQRKEEQKEELAEEQMKVQTELEDEAVAVSEPEDITPQTEKSKVKAKKKKLNLEPAINWIGLFISLAAFGVFIFLLAI